MARYVEVDKLKNDILMKYKKNWEVPCSSEDRLIQSVVTDLRVLIEMNTTTDVAPRAEVAREIFGEIYAEIFEMLPLKVFRLIDGTYVEKSFESGKERALHDVLNCIAELEKKYTEGRK